LRSEEVKSTEVYRVIKRVVGPWCKQNGFRKGPGGMLCYVKQQDARHVVFWFQCSQDGWDAYAGSKFVVEFQFSALGRPGAFGDDCVRDRFSHVLDESDLERVRQMQNQVISKLTLAHDEYFIWKMSDGVRSWYLDKFKPVERRYEADDDIWLRYKDEDDVTNWSEFVLEMLPKVLARLTA
jgi:hypothetical protein